MNHPRLAIVMSVLSALAFIGGCDKQEQPTAAAPAPQSASAPPVQAPSAPAATAAAAAPAAAATPAVAPAQAATPAAIAVAAPSVVATADGETTGVKADITELKRNSGNTLTLKFNLINGSTKDVRLSGGDYSSGDKYGSFSGVYLLDVANKKKYLVLRDTDDHCVCSMGLKDLEPNSSVTLWAKFPAPPADVQKISISIPHFAPLDDVPISQ